MSVIRFFIPLLFLYRFSLSIQATLVARAIQREISRRQLDILPQTRAEQYVTDVLAVEAAVTVIQTVESVDRDHAYHLYQPLSPPLSSAGTRR